MVLAAGVRRRRRGGDSRDSTSAVANSRSHDDRLGGAVLLFGLFGDRAADGLASLVWDWDRQTMGYGTGIWWPFQICAALVSYAGFALSAWVVARLHRGNPAMLLAYVASVTAGLVVSAVILEVLIHRYDRVPLPHPLFYLVSVTLPFHWRSGFLLVPCIMVVCGLRLIERPRYLDRVRRSGEFELRIVSPELLTF